MGIFSRLFNARPTTEKSDQDLSYIAEITKLISDDDTEVMNKIALCIDDISNYAELNSGKYKERGIDINNCDNDTLGWICMIDKLEENGYLFSVDHNCEAVDLLWALSQIKTYDLIKDAVSELELDKSKDIEAWAEEINLAISGALVCMIDIDSDSYELIIVSHDVYDKISVIAQNKGHSIEVF
ncbi:MAG: hypothetical protein IJX77_08360 [Ruminococcus sp.]|nr:hypothetical protein [Ruminococcus sp.]